MLRDAMTIFVAITIVLTIVVVLAGCQAGRQSNPSCVAHCYAIARDSDEDNAGDESPYLSQSSSVSK